MNTNPQFIQRGKITDPSTNFFELRKEGIHYLQELSGHLWTNYNPHDPGVILLETLCYVLTELGYKSNFPIADILQSIPEASFQPQENALYTKEEIFTTHPITLTDYRILLIDQLAPEINNVWVEAIKNSNDEFTGKYLVWLLPDDHIPINEAQLVTKASDCMAAHRNLGEYVRDIRFMNRKRALIHANIQLKNEASSHKVLASFFYHLEEKYLNPTFHRFTANELSEKGYTVDEIYNVPKTRHGYFDKSQLKDFPKSIEVEELIQLLFEIDEGVLKVDEFKVYIEGIEYSNKIPLNYFLPQFFPSDDGHQINCYQHGVLLDTETIQVIRQINKLKKGIHRNYEIQLVKEGSEKVLGKRREITTILPIENDLPTVFGLGYQSLPKHCGDEEKQQLLQLRSYLQLMDQFIANASHKLGHFASFFSIHASSYTKIKQRSYSDFSEVELAERHHILDHLLARFNIQFPKYAEAPDTKKQIITEIKAKECCLQHIPVLTANRSAGPNLKKSLWEASNTATVCKWLHLYLGYTDFTVRSVSNHLLPIISNLRKKNRFLNDLPVTEIIRRGVTATHYSIVQNRKYYVVWLNLKHTKIYLGKRKTKIKAKQLRNTIRKTITIAHTKSKSFYVLENFLVEKDATYTVSLFFPNWTPEIQHNRFKAFIKSQAVELLPTHIYAKFYALPLEEMQAFEGFYKEIDFQKEKKNLNIDKKYKVYRF